MTAPTASAPLPGPPGPSPAPPQTAPPETGLTAPARASTRRSHAGRKGLRRLGATAVLGATVAVTGLVAAGPASAMSPAQTQYSGVVNLLATNQAGSIATFWQTTMASWGKAYTKPRLYYYDNAAGQEWNTPCGSTAAKHDNSFYCSGDNAIFLDYTWNQGFVTRLGDYSAGGILAHEWGHAIQAWLGQGYVGARSEVAADCLAGMYTRWGYASGRLTGSDYSEMYGWLYNQPTSASHSSGAIRSSWFQYGYTQYSLAACNQAYTASASTVSAMGATGGSTLGVSAGANTATALPSSAARPVLPEAVGLPARTGPVTAAAPAVVLVTSDGISHP